ncbi:unnamed protein product, partial [Didymodactylos carnosus]
MFTMTDSSININDENLEDLTVIWLDENINKTNDCLDTKTRLRYVINYLKTFIDPDECIDYITSISNERVFLIISGSFGENIIPLISDLKQILSIYIFCSNKFKYEQWAHNYEKIQG